MTYDDKTSEMVLSTGKRFYACSSILGLGDDDPGMTYGYDGIVDSDHIFTPEERKEIAGTMINRWTRWAEAA